MRLRSRLGFALLCLSAMPVESATIVVNSLTDAITVNGLCTLREAIIAANANATTGDCTAGSLVDTDIIVFSLSGTIAPTSALPALTGAVMINAFGSLANPGAICPAWATPRPIVIDGINAGNVVAFDLRGGSTLRGLAIGRYASIAVYVQTGPANRLQCNFIGTDAAGNSARGNTAGLQIQNSNDNIVGTDGDGINDANEGNLLSGSLTVGALLGGTAAQNRIAGNRVGTNAAGTALIPNSSVGIAYALNTVANIVGSNGDGISDVLEANLISGNAAGVTGEGASGASIRGNTISNNVGLGIDLGDSYISPNDALDVDIGVQNFPVITSYAAVGSNLRIAGTLNSTPATTFRLDFYANTECDDSGFGEGAAHLGSTVTAATNGSGNVSFEFLFPASPSELASPPPIAATATGPAGTSEFSACFRAAPIFKNGFE